jgi:hypothetical protein
VRLLRRALLVVFSIVVTAWLAASAALAIGLPFGWRMSNWPLSVPGFAAMSPEGVVLRWTPMDWRGLRVTGQNFTPRGSRLGPIRALDAELALRGPPGLDGTAWRQAGGHVEVVGLSILWGPLRFSGAGELRPTEDGAMRGPLRGRLEGLDGAMAILLRSATLGTATRVQGEVELPLSLLRDGSIMLGPLLIASWR